jgi:hypothetical protein
VPRSGFGEFTDNPLALLGVAGSASSVVGVPLGSLFATAPVGPAWFVASAVAVSAQAAWYLLWRRRRRSGLVVTREVEGLIADLGRLLERLSGLEQTTQVRDLTAVVLEVGAKMAPVGAALAAARGSGADAVDAQHADLREVVSELRAALKALEDEESTRRHFLVVSASLEASARDVSDLRAVSASARAQAEGSRDVQDVALAEVIEVSGSAFSTAVRKAPVETA